MIVLGNGVARLYVVALVVLVTGCANSVPPPMAYPDLTWQHKQPITFLAFEREVIDQSGDTAPVQFGRPLTLPIDPALQLRNWFNQRLALSQGGYGLRLVIEQASVTREKLPREQGLAGLFTDELQYRVTLDLKARVEVRTATGTVGKVRSNVTRTAGLRESLSLAEREDLLYELIDAGMRDLDAEMERHIRTFFGKFVQR